MLTVGHGPLEQEALRDLLVGAGVRHLVDVRRRPSSRRHPHADRDALSRWLPDAGIAYTWEEGLGGRREALEDSPHVALDEGFRGYADHIDTYVFREALARVLVLDRDTTVAVMCAEGDWRACHRRLIADAALLLYGAIVEHLRHDGTTKRHTPTTHVRVDGDRLVYDLKVDRPLPFDDAPTS